jgi:hypothetical protein
VSAELDFVLVCLVLSREILLLRVAFFSLIYGVGVLVLLSTFGLCYWVYPERFLRVEELMRLLRWAPFEVVLYVRSTEYGTTLVRTEYLRITSSAYRRFIVLSKWATCHIYRYCRDKYRLFPKNSSLRNPTCTTPTHIISYHSSDARP